MSSRVPMLSIQGLDKIELLRELWENAIIDYFIYEDGSPPPMEFDYGLAEQALTNPYTKGIVWMFLGRDIRINFNEKIKGINVIDTRFYDAYNESGKAEKIIERLMQKS